MADQSHLQKLFLGVQSWRRWRRENPGVKVDLSEGRFPGRELSGAELRAVDLKYANLRGADLSEANLLGADLSHADLRWANLRGANLRRALLTGANLGNANLRRADLTLADFFKAKLVGADASEANLSEADFTGADLSKADLTGAYLDEDVNFSNCVLGDTIFVRVNLRDVIGLEAIDHYGPSVVDHNTLRESSPLPEIFLRGCGFSESEILSTKLLYENLDHHEASVIGHEFIRLCSRDSHPSN